MIGKGCCGGLTEMDGEVVASIKEQKTREGVRASQAA